MVKVKVKVMVMVMVKVKVRVMVMVMVKVKVRVKVMVMVKVKVMVKVMVKVKVMVTMTLTLKLARRVISKKNSKRMIFRGGRRFLVPSKAFEVFASNAVADIHEQIKKIPNNPLFTGPVKIHTDLFIPGKSIADGDNLHTSILDVLQLAKIIDDDKNVMEGSYKKYPGSGGW